MDSGLWISIVDADLRLRCARSIENIINSTKLLYLITTGQQNLSQHLPFRESADARGHYNHLDLDSLEVIKLNLEEYTAHREELSHCFKHFILPNPLYLSKSHK